MKKVHFAGSLLFDRNFLSNKKSTSCRITLRRYGIMSQMRFCRMRRILQKQDSFLIVTRYWIQTEQESRNCTDD